MEGKEATDAATRAAPKATRAIDAVYRNESRRIFATLVRILGDFDLAEEALHDAFAAAMEAWPRDGVPDRPRSWLIATGRNRAIDRIRRRARYDRSLEALARELETMGRSAAGPVPFHDGLEDDRLRLVFTCCHPALSPDARVALTLREVCGLTTEEIARAFLTSAPTLAQRIVRAKAKIRDAKIPFEVPERHDLPERLDSVLRVVYLVFNEGYAASSGDALTRPDLSGEALRLGRLLVDLLPEPETMGLLALMLLHEARRTARASESGELVPLDEQDRTRWDRARIGEGVELVERALRTGRFGAYSLQAAIVAVHAESPSWEETDWPQIVALYDVLLRLDPSPIIELNRAVAVAMRDGADQGLALIDGILRAGELEDYQSVHAARADLLRQLGRPAEARVAYERALALTLQEPERRFLERRLAELGES